jgi:hypothetical protein
LTDILASGAKVNVQKSEILCIGRGELHAECVTQISIKVCEDTLLVLGVYVSKSQQVCNELKWKPKVQQVKQMLNMWLQRKLTIHGRVTVIISMITSKLWYTLMVQNIPEWALN